MTPELVEAAETIAVYLRSNNSTSMELGSLSISLRASSRESAVEKFQLSLVERMCQCSKEIQKTTYNSDIASLMYAHKDQMSFLEQYSSTGQFTGGFRTECYEEGPLLFFFDIDDADLIMECEEVNKEAWVKWREKDKFVLSFC